MKHNRVIAILSIVSTLLLTLMLVFTSPTEIGPFGVLVFFTTLYVALFGVCSLLLKTFYKIAMKNREMGKKDYLSAAVMAFGPIMVLMARSFGAVNIWTIALIVIFLTLAEFLVAKRT